MRRGSAGYERELKELLQGDPEALRRYAHHLPAPERARFERHAERPFLVVRAAGSLGFDLVALRPEFAFPIEVKSSSDTTIRFSSAGGRATAQMHEHEHAAGRVHLVVLYAYRRVGHGREEAWRLFWTGPAQSEGRIRLVSRELPRVEVTPEKHGILRWEDGYPLSRFLAWVGMLTEPPKAASS